MDVNEKFRDRAEQKIFAATMEAKARTFPWYSCDEVAERAWAMVLEYRSRCPAEHAGMSFKTIVVEAISTGLGRSAEDWETMPAVEPDAANDGGPTEADLQGEVE